jgi:hypothetical protein
MASMPLALIIQAFGGQRHKLTDKDMIYHVPMEAVH